MYHDEREYRDIFADFMERETLKEMMVDLDIEIGVYLLPFLGIKSRLKTNEE